MLWVYFMVSQVVLVNLLVAIMGDTWSSVKESADVEWRFLFVENIEEFFDMPHVPPPFNARLLFRHFGRKLLGLAQDDRSDSGERVRRGTKLSAGDIKKKAKEAQVRRAAQRLRAFAPSPPPFC